MFDIGGFELLVIAVVALVVIGPKELPGTLRTVAFWVRKARSMAREFQAGFEELTREAELDELRREVNAAIEKDPFEEAAHGVRETVEHSIGPEIYSDLDAAYPGSPVEGHLGESGSESESESESTQAVDAAEIKPEPEAASQPHEPSGHNGATPPEPVPEPAAAPEADRAHASAGPVPRKDAAEG